MRIPTLSIILCCCLNSNISAQQCDTYIQMVALVIDGCGVLPQIVGTSQFLLPCSAPAGYNQLEEGDFAYIEYSNAGCANICLAAPEVDITCLSFPVGVGEEEAENEIKVFPTIVQDQVYIEGKDIIRIEVYDDRGVQMIIFKEPNVTTIDMGCFGPEVYFIRVMTEKRIQIKKVFKL